LWNYHGDAAYKIEFIRDQGITTLFGPPSDWLPMIDLCQRQGTQLPDCLQHILLGSAPVHAAFLEKLIAVLPGHCRISCLYGMTENLLVCSVDGRQKIRYNGPGDLLGQPVENVELKIADDGEILLRSDQLFCRYLHLDEWPAWHATGDLGYLDDNRALVLTGRKKQMIIRRHQNIYPGLYEPTINKIPAVQQAVMIGCYSETLHDEQVFLVVEASDNISEAALRKQLEYGPHSIDREALPDHIIFRRLPRKGRQQKVDRQLLQLEVSKKFDLKKRSADQLSNTPKTLVR
ncbi:MAG: class I adenylate-forming enzyme family protein, partial [Bacteroidota bacterium]